MRSSRSDAWQLAAIEHVQALLDTQLPAMVKFIKLSVAGLAVYQGFNT